MPRVTAFAAIGFLCLVLALFLGIAAVRTSSVFGAFVSLFVVFIGYRVLAAAFQVSADAEKLQRGRVR